MRMICIDGDEEVVRDAGLDVEKNVNAVSRLVPPSKLSLLQNPPHLQHIRA